MREDSGRPGAEGYRFLWFHFSRRSLIRQRHFQALHLVSEPFHSRACVSSRPRHFCANSDVRASALSQRSNSLLQRKAKNERQHERHGAAVRSICEALGVKFLGYFVQGNFRSWGYSGRAQFSTPFTLMDRNAIVAPLRDREAELRALGVVSLLLLGSATRRKSRIADISVCVPVPLHYLTRGARRRKPN